jgi:glyoxylase-like metal-dependent hydrolase (beta-lactamase superfamily II)
VTRVRVERFGDVARLRLSSIGSRAVRLDVSTYVVRGVMIDTGFPRARGAVVEALATLGVHGAIVTHWHEDHGGNAAPLARLGVPLLMRPETEAILRHRPEIPLYRRVVWGHPRRLDRPLTAPDVHGLECIHTPGHSREHQVVWDPSTGTLFSGDLWLGVRSRVIHLSEDPYEIVSSLRRVARLEPARLFDAHRGFVERPTHAIAAKIDWMSETIGDIEQRIAGGWSDRQIVDRVLGGEEMAGYMSRGDYTRRNFVRAIRRKLSG